MTSESFSKEFENLMKGLGQAAGEALNAFQEELASIFGGLEDVAENEEDGEFDDFKEFAHFCYILLHKNNTMTY